MEIQKEELKKLIDCGLSYQEIGNRLNCGREKIRRIAIAYNIDRKHIYAHPNLKINYFQNIDSKEKAYWLGFLYADGYVKPDNCALVLDLSTKDIEHLNKFCETIGANNDKIKIRIHKNFIKDVKSASIKISNKQFVNNLINLGCTNKKSKTIRWPHTCLQNIELSLSFLAGYFDGDGIAGSTSICCGSLQFLEDIKSIFNINTNIILKDKVYILKIGSELKMKMVKTYPFGLIRKQGKHNAATNKDRLKCRKFNPSKQELEELLIDKKMSYVSIGKYYGVSDNSIKKRAIKLGIILSGKK
jgi:hypothetical protein